MISLQQCSACTPFEVFTLDKLYTPDEIERFRQYIQSADIRNRNFTSSPFKNGKVIHTEWSSLMYKRIRPHLPDVYVDRQGLHWSFVESPKYIMYANVQQNQRFGIHTDTGCEYDLEANKYSKFTVLTYLNKDFEGGETKFYDDRFNNTLTIQPFQNRTLVFDIDLFHSGEPVVSGSKFWIGTELVCAKVQDEKNT